MGVLTSSWWEVSQLIVAAIFIYAFPYLDLLYLLIVSLLCPTFGGATFMVSVDIIAYLLYVFAGDVSVLSIAWVWQPRDCVREAYKRIGHAEISNF